jgi:hypothetical protein
MALNRNKFSNLLFGRKYYGTSAVNSRIFRSVEQGVIECDVRTLSQGQRLDQIAGLIYGNSSLWWVIAAASGIGWGLQVPPGTMIRIPVNINDVYAVL